MADMMATAATWFESQRRAHLSQSATYLPLAGIPYTGILVTIVTGKWDVMDAAGQMVRVQTKDIFVPVADYPEEPVRGDRIYIDGTEETYEVVVPPGRGQCWMWSDVGDKLRRIHCMKVEV